MENTKITLKDLLFRKDQSPEFKAVIQNYTNNIIGKLRERIELPNLNKTSNLKPKKKLPLYKIKAQKIKHVTRKLYGIAQLKKKNEENSESFLDKTLESDLFKLRNRKLPLSKSTGNLSTIKNISNSMIDQIKKGEITFEEKKQSSPQIKSFGNRTITGNSSVAELSKLSQSMVKIVRQKEKILYELNVMEEPSMKLNEFSQYFKVFLADVIREYKEEVDITKLSLKEVKYMLKEYLKDYEGVERKRNIVIRKIPFLSEELQVTKDKNKIKILKEKQDFYYNLISKLDLCKEKLYTMISICKSLIKKK